MFKKESCLQITTGIKAIKAKKLLFVEYFHDEKYDDAFALSKEIQMQIDEIVKNISVSFKDAKEILDADLSKEEKEKGVTNIFGLEEVKKAFPGQIEMTESEVPPIPFSLEELKIASKLGQMLILRVDKFSDGSPITIERMREVFDNHFEKGGSVLYEPGRMFETEEFFAREENSMGWALVSKKVLINSTNRDYFQQTDYLVDEVCLAFGGVENLPVEYVKALEKYNLMKGRITGKNDYILMEELKNLEITRLLRPTAVEVFFDLIVYYQNTGVRLQKDTYAMTRSWESTTKVVGVGAFETDGIDFCMDPMHSHDLVSGVVLSRTK